jgi:hypothetical protein
MRFAQLSQSERRSLHRVAVGLAVAGVALTAFTIPAQTGLVARSFSSLVGLRRLLLLAISASAAPPKTEAEAGVIVTNLVRKMGVKLERYEQPKVHSEKKGEWWFFYTLKPPGMPGGHFTVIVDADGKATYRGGR